MSRERREFKKSLKEDELKTWLAQAIEFMINLWKNYDRFIKIGAAALVILIIAIIIMIGNKNKMNGEASVVMAEAHRQFQTGNYERSTEILDSVIKKYSGSSYIGEALYYKGNCLYYLGRYDDAVESYKKALRKSLHSYVRAHVLEGIAYAYAQKNDYVSAEGEYKKLLYKPLYQYLKADAMLGIAKCQEAQNKTDEAIRTYEDVVNTFPNSNFANIAKERSENLMKKGPQKDKPGNLKLPLPR